MNAVDALLKLMQQFDRNVTVHRNAIGCLVLLTKDRRSGDRMLSRSGGGGHVP